MNDVLNPFDPASLRLDQTFTDGTAVKRLLTTIPVRKPNRQDFVRVHPDADYRLSPAAIIELKDDREVYLVTPAIAPDLVGEIAAATITAANFFLAYYASAEIGCHLALGWPKPTRILDLFTEFRCRTNGLTTPAGAGLVGALAYYGLDSMAASEKDAMRALVLCGGPWSEQSARRSSLIASRMLPP